MRCPEPVVVSHTGEARLPDAESGGYPKIGYPNGFDFDSIEEKKQSWRGHKGNAGLSAEFRSYEVFSPAVTAV